MDIDPYDQLCKSSLSRNQRIFINVIDITNLTVLDILFQTVSWVGWWNLLAYWAWPWSEELFVERDVIYFILGVLLKFVGVVWCPEEDIPYEVALEWQNGVPPTWGWTRRLKNFGIRQLHFIAFLFMWVGAWNFFDLYIYSCGYCWKREIFYIFIPLVFLFFSQEVLSRDSLYWIFDRYFKKYSYDIEDPGTPLAKNRGGYNT